MQGRNSNRSDRGRMTPDRFFAPVGPEEAAAVATEEDPQQQQVAAAGWQQEGAGMEDGEEGDMEAGEELWAPYQPQQEAEEEAGDGGEEEYDPQQAYWQKQGREQAAEGGVEEQEEDAYKPAKHAWGRGVSTLELPSSTLGSPGGGGGFGGGGGGADWALATPSALLKPRSAAAQAMELDPKDITLGQRLGGGAFATVYAATMAGSKRKWVVKRLDRCGRSQLSSVRAQAEFDMT